MIETTFLSQLFHNANVALSTNSRINSSKNKK
jgi:hypothetical protein